MIDVTAKLRKTAITTIAYITPFVFGGCYAHSLSDAPKPEFKEEAIIEENPEFKGIANSPSDWNKYVSKLEQLCASTSENLDGKEEQFYRFINWMNKLAGKQFDPTKFDITQPNPFMPAGIFWYGKILIETKSMSLSTLAHEFGHFTDAYLNYLNYGTSKKAAARMDAVGEAFKHYVGLELIRSGNEFEGRKMLLSPKTFENRKSMDDVALNENRYETARAICSILINEHKEMRKVWYALATQDADQIYKMINEIIEKNKDLDDAIRNGSILCVQEISKVKQKSLK